MSKSFNSLKNRERIETMYMMLEKDVTTSKVAEEVGVSTTTVRKYMNDMVEAGLVEKTDESEYEYTNFGKRFKANMEMLWYEDEVEWMKKSRERAEDVQREMKTMRKQRIKQKIGELLS